jgi:hypothetical protein
MKIGPKKFLKFVRCLMDQNIIGHLVCWASDYCSQNSIEFQETIQNYDSNLISYVNKRAEFFECFNSNPKVNRAFVSRKSDAKSPKISEEEAENPSSYRKYLAIIFVIFLISMVASISW